MSENRRPVHSKWQITEMGEIRKGMVVVLCNKNDRDPVLVTDIPLERGASDDFSMMCRFPTPGRKWFESKVSLEDCGIRPKTDGTFAGSYWVERPRLWDLIRFTFSRLYRIGSKE